MPATFYSRQEICDILQESADTIAAWETEFGLHIAKDPRLGNIYSENDLRDLQYIQEQIRLRKVPAIQVKELLKDSSRTSALDTILQKLDELQRANAQLQQQLQRVQQRLDNNEKQLLILPEALVEKMLVMRQADGWTVFRQEMAETAAAAASVPAKEPPALSPRASKKETPPKQSLWARFEQWLDGK